MEECVAIMDAICERFARSGDFASAVVLLEGALWPAEGMLPENIVRQWLERVDTYRRSLSSEESDKV